MNDLSHPSCGHWNMRSLLCERRCSCKRAGRLKALMQFSKGQRCILRSEGYLDLGFDLTDSTAPGEMGVAVDIVVDCSPFISRRESSNESRSLLGAGDGEGTYESIASFSAHNQSAKCFYHRPHWR